MRKASQRIFTVLVYVCSVRATGIIDKSDQLGLLVIDLRPKHGVGLPKLVCVLHAKSQAALVFAWIVFEHFVLFEGFFTSSGTISV